jgi:hypothetical protein
LSLLARNDGWGHRYSPFAVLRGVLGGEGQTAAVNGATITWRRFGVNYQAVADLRRKIIDAAIDQLSGADINRSLLAGRFIGEGLHYPGFACFAASFPGVSHHIGPSRWDWLFAASPGRPDPAGMMAE